MNMVAPVLFAAFVCAACEVKTEERPIPKDWRLLVEPYGAKAYVAPVTMEDGTKCVVVVGSSGRGISCNWK